MIQVHPTRRGFLKGCLAAGAAPLIFTSRASGESASTARINVALVGTGRQATLVNLPAFLEMPEVRVVALCDVDAWRLDQAKQKVDAFYGNSDCAVYRDWREVLAREDVDAVMNSTPDHWHVPISLAAVQAGKHVSCEKPLTLSIADGRRLADAARAAGIVFRTDTECRSHADMHRIVELVRNGYIGTVTHIDVGVPQGDTAGGNPEAVPVPDVLDYVRWRGAAPWKPYTVDRVHPVRELGRPGWMRCSDTCEGIITNWGTHMLDVAQLVLDTERSGPVAVEANGVYPPQGSGLWDVLVSFEAHFRYANGVTLRYHTDPRGAYIKVTGEEGWIHGDWLRKAEGFVASDPAILETVLKPEDQRFPQRTDKQDFINAIMTGEPVMIDAEIGHRACSMGQLAHIAIKRARPLDWDPATERFTNDDEANQLLQRPLRVDEKRDIV